MRVYDVRGSAGSPGLAIDPGLKRVDELICRAHHGRASDAEQARLIAWRRASLDNERYHRELVQLLDEFTASEFDEEVDPPPLIEDLISPHSGSRAARGRSRYRSLSLQASVLITAAAVSLFVLGSRLGAPADPGLGTGEVVTGISEYSTVRLADGTTVRLGPESRLRMVGEAGKREVWLEGRAFFAVTRNEARPLRIRTHGGDAVILGTRFDIRAREDDLRVLVVQGTVKIGAGGSEVQLNANEMGSIGTDRAPRREHVDAGQIEKELEWVGNFLAFENTPLSQVAQEMSTLYGVPVHILDASLARETVRGVFVNEAIEDVLGVLCRALSAHCSVADTGVTIGP